MNVLMIMCHRDPQQVIRLASRCRTENTDVVIHCDSAMPPADFDLVAEFVLGGGDRTPVFDRSTDTRHP